jgi:hypothetical protein
LLYLTKMAKENKSNEELPHITLEPSNNTRTQDVRRGFGSFSFKPIEQDQFKNMLGEVISVGTVITEKFRNTYFLIDLTTEYYSPAVYDMLKSLNLEIKTVLNEMQIVVKGDEKHLKEYEEKSKILKKITNPIRRIHPLDENEKIGSELLSKIKEDVDRTKVFPISIKLIDNLDEVEESEFKKQLGEELKKDLNPKYLKYSKQFICGSSAKRVERLSKIQYIKRITKIPKIKPQEESSESEIYLRKGEFRITANPMCPTICIIDSGVSNELSKFCSHQDPFIFNSPNDTVGHGTGVSTIAIFGEDIIKKSKSLIQKTKLISVKLDDKEAKDVAIEEAIMHAINKYSNQTKIFCLSYAFLDDIDLRERLEIVKRLDYFLQEKNVILLISAGNIDLLDAYSRKSDYPNYLTNFPVLSPSEAKNAFAVGAICKKSTTEKCIPSVITRMGLNPIFLRDELDKYRFFKPDIFTYGGNSELKLKGVNILPSPDLELPVMDLEGNLKYSLGTSFSAPLMALCFSRLYQKYSYENSETYKAVMLNQANYAEINNLPVHYIVDTKNVANSNDGIYLNFEGKVTPRVRREDVKKINVFECKSVEFHMPPEAESIDIFTVHSNNYKFQDLRKYNTRLVVQIIKGNGVAIAKKYGTISRNCANTYAHYDFSRNFEGTWKINVHVETRGIPAEELEKLRVRFGVSLRINLKQEYKDKLKEIHEKVLVTSKIKNGVEIKETKEANLIPNILESDIEAEKGVT